MRKERIVTNNFWEDFDYTDPKDSTRLIEALQFSFSLPNPFIPEKFNPSSPHCKNKALAEKFVAKKEGFEKARMQYFASLADFPATAKDAIAKYHEIPLYDNGFESVFDIRDFSGSRRDGYSILTVQSGLTFRRVMTGEKLKVYAMSGDKEYVYFDFYGGALGWHRSLFEDQNYWIVEDNAIEFRNEAYRIRAATFYALIEAVATVKATIAWQAPTPAGLPVTDRGYEAIRDANTLNTAAQTILLACANKGYGISPQTVSFIVLAPIQLRGRMKRALDVTLDARSNGEKHIDYNFRLLTTTMLTATDRYWVILPGKKLTAGYRMELTTFTDFDILSYVDTVAGWMRYGGAVGDTDQLEYCAIA